ncbi:hypothetical protein LSM04_001804 [Trypanosoma melophagium]|uniref:uncharacterized protein n=1 Tax=Trypanosoma melophagium TaxID=715481 RepID=UPI003519F129|nr:hypothetical protein LSM04_001804 [Trypanosoma melophagium]
MLVEIAERLRTVLERAAWHLYAGEHVTCSLALLPTIALNNMPHEWGMADVIQQQSLSYVELIVGLSKDILSETLTKHLFELQKRKEEKEKEESTQLLTNKEKVGPILLGLLVPHLSTEMVFLALLLLPAHSTLWNQRRRSLSAFLHNDNNKNDMDKCQRDRSFLVLALLQELLFTSLLLSLHYKMQEVWVHRWWIVQELFKIDGMRLKAFLWHDRLVLQEAADKHLMNYNAWNYRRNVFTRILKIEKEKNAANGVESEEMRSLFLEETSIVLRFFETHNADTSAVSYLIYLLQEASATYPPLPVNAELQDWISFLPFHIWRLLMNTTAQELRRHYDKGHETVWVLRLALMQWALHTKPPCGWTLQDELQYIMLFATSVWNSEDNDKMEDVTWLDVSGSCRWTSYHATRYGLQILQMVHPMV